MFRVNILFILTQSSLSSQVVVNACLNYSSSKISFLPKPNSQTWILLFLAAHLLFFLLIILEAKTYTNNNKEGKA